MKEEETLLSGHFFRSWWPYVGNIRLRASPESEKVLSRYVKARGIGAGSTILVHDRIIFPKANGTNLPIPL